MHKMYEDLLLACVCVCVIRWKTIVLVENEARVHAVEFDADVSLFGSRC